MYGPTHLAIPNETDSDDGHHRRMLGDTNSSHDDVPWGPTSINGMAVVLCIPSMITTVIVATIALLINVQV